MPRRLLHPAGLGRRGDAGFSLGEISGIPTSVTHRVLEVIYCAAAIIRGAFNGQAQNMPLCGLNGRGSADSWNRNHACCSLARWLGRGIDSVAMLVHVTVHCGCKQPTFDGRLEGELIAIANYFRSDRLNFHRHVCIREPALPDIGYIRFHPNTGMTASEDGSVRSLLFVFKIPKTSMQSLHC